MSSEIRAVLVTRDARMIGVFSEGLRNLGIDTVSIGEVTSVANMSLRSKIEGLILDFDDLGDQLSSFGNLRNSRSNQDAVVIGVATGGPNQELASKNGAHFLIARPFVPAQVQQTLEAAYRLMLHGRREHFRLAASLEVSLHGHSGVTVECTTINVSRNGMAINTPYPLAIGESLDLSFLAPGQSVVLRVRATVVWEDKHGKAGLRFERANEDIEEHLYPWLDEQCLMWHKVS